MAARHFCEKFCRKNRKDLWCFSFTYAWWHAAILTHHEMKNSVVWLGGAGHDFWLVWTVLLISYTSKARMMVSEGLPMIILSHLIQSCPHAMIYIMDLLIMCSFIQVGNVIIQWYLLGSLIYYLNLYRTWIVIFCHQWHISC